jgi:hypothetical protein
MAIFVCCVPSCSVPSVYFNIYNCIFSQLFLCKDKKLSYEIIMVCVCVHAREHVLTCACLCLPLPVNQLTIYEKIVYESFSC